MSGCLAYIYDHGLLIIIISCSLLASVEGRCFDEHSNIINICFYFLAEFLVVVILGLIVAIFFFGRPIKFIAYGR
jgi:hypothetical protein